MIDPGTTVMLGVNAAVIIWGAAIIKTSVDRLSKTSEAMQNKQHEHDKDIALLQDQFEAHKEEFHLHRKRVHDAGNELTVRIMNSFDKMTGLLDRELKKNAG